MIPVGMRIHSHGEIAGSATAAQCPDVKCSFVKFKAEQGNATNVYIGLSSAVTKVAGTTNGTAGWELDAGQETDWLPCRNLNEFWRICDVAGDDLVYITLR